MAPRPGGAVHPDPRGSRALCRDDPSPAAARHARRSVRHRHAARRDPGRADAVLAIGRDDVPRVRGAGARARGDRTLQRDGLHRRAADAGARRPCDARSPATRPRAAGPQCRLAGRRRRHRDRGRDRARRGSVGGTAPVPGVAARSARLWVRGGGAAGHDGMGELRALAAGGAGRSDGSSEVRMTDLLQDLRFALRSLRKNPGFSTIAIVTLALGIGANTAIFSAVDAVLLKPLPYPHADRLVSLDTKVPGPGKDIFGSSMSYPDMQQLQALTRDFSGVAAYRDTRYNYAGGEQALELTATVVSPNLFGVLGVSPAIGRGFTGAELHDRLAVLSYGMWATAFGSDRNIVGRAINLDGQSFTVVGVMPRGFAFPNEDTQLWVPLGEALRSDPRLQVNRQFYAFEAVARLAAGATLAQARADVGVVAQRIASGMAFRVDPLKVEGVEDVRSALLVLFGAVGLVLLIACANAAGLYVARATGRRKEGAVPRALGADRARLARQLLTESVVVALIAGAAGVLLARWGLGAVLGVGRAPG